MYPHLESPAGYICAHLCSLSACLSVSLVHIHTQVCAYTCVDITLLENHPDVNCKHQDFPFKCYMRHISRVGHSKTLYLRKLALVILCVCAIHAQIFACQAHFTFSFFCLGSSGDKCLAFVYYAPVIECFLLIIIIIFLMEFLGISYTTF